MQQAAWQGSYEWAEPKGAQHKGGKWQGGQSQRHHGCGTGKQGMPVKLVEQQRQQPRSVIGGRFAPQQLPCQQHSE
eukprot:11098388-Alexandrium_andersonii.AAC.1